LPDKDKKEGEKMGIPRRDGEFDLWFFNLKNYVAAKTGSEPPAWTHIPVEKTAELTARYEARDESMDEMRDFANGHIRYNRQMSVSEKDYLGIKPHNPPTPHPTPASQPDTDVRNTRNNFEHEVRALNAEGSAVKPDDAYGVAFAWQVGGERPATGADLPKGEFSRKPVKVVRHTEADKGKTAYYATAYENSKGEKGPWSPVVEAVIA
jgi:hypothetical protein